MNDQSHGAPPLPACVDLRDFPGMMLEVARLRDSAIVFKTRPEEFRSAVLLWCASWHQVPAASLPDDEAELAKFAGYGLMVKAWAKVRAGALRGFVKCSDGRLYHRVVAEKAIAAFQSKLQQRYDSECGRLKKEAQRKKQKEWHKPEFALWITKECPEFLPHLSRRHARGVPEDSAPMSPGQPPPCPGETASKGREGKGYIPASTSTSRNTSGASPPVDNPGADAPKSTPRAAAHQRGHDPIAEGKRMGITPHRGESMEAFEDRVRTTRAA